MASPVIEQGCFSDVRKVGYLRKPKSMHKRFFVLRIATVSGPSRLEYYENEKKWNQKSGAPKRSILLHNCFNINKRVDSKNKYLIALYTKDEYFAVAADSEQEQDLWYEALVDLHNRGKIYAPFGNSITAEEYGEATPGPAFKDVWQVILKPKGLGQIKNLVGIYRLCLTNKTISFVKLNSDAAAVVLQLMNIRRCGHSENFFFIEVGRSAVTGSGEFWMQVDDSVVAQNMHETILEAMKAMSEEFCPRSKSQSSSNCSNPISVPLRRHHHNNLPPSQVGLSRRSRAESLTAGSPAFSGKHSHSFRVRASSDGEGTMSRPASVDGSPGSPITARTHPHRPRGSSRLHPPLSHSRSTPMTAACCSPSATSPVSLSSSSTSGHGSTSDGLYPRRSSTSVSGSPSDGDFISSDEYGSSPCDFRGSFHSVTPDSIEHTPPAREEELSSYICMATAGLQLNGYSGQFQSCCSESCTAEPEKGLGKRTHSSGTLVNTACYQQNPSQDTAGSYTVMMPMHQCIRMPIDRQSAFAATDSYPEQDLQTDASAIGHKDDGYMPMSPGVVPQPSKSNEYMPMSPRNASEPQQIISADPVSIMHGYMMMSPSGSCSPETKYSKIWTNGTDPKLSVESNDGEVAFGDYMNMYPASYSSKGTQADSGFHQLEEPCNPLNSYHSLPRSFRHGDRQHHQTPRPMSVISVQLEESSSSSASSDSLGGRNGGQQIVTPTKIERERKLLGQPKRPTRLFLENCKASTLPRARENTFPNEPKSPGEYVRIDFNDQSSTASLVSLLPVYLDSSCERSEQQFSEYIKTELGSGSNLCHSNKILVSADQLTIVEAPSLSVLDSDDLQSSDYVSMQLRSTCVNHTEEHLILRNPKMGGSAPEAPSNIISPRHEGVALKEFPGMMNQTSGLGAFTRVGSSPNQKQGTRVIRVDPQGQRRHSSETFSSTAVACGIMAPFSMQNGKCDSSASFENVWLNPCELAAQEKNGMSCETGPSPQDSLNYIFLDLLKDQNPLEFNFQIAKPLDSQNGNNSDLNMYASITFEK